MEIKILSQENGMAKVGLTLPGSELTKAIDKYNIEHFGFTQQQLEDARMPVQIMF